MKYAKLELERRFLLRNLPDGIDPDRGFRRIDDFYVKGTRMRLRRVVDENGKPVAFKLTQKYRSPEMPHLHTIITNFNLNEVEFDALGCLGGQLLSKRRYPFVDKGRHYSIDVYEGDLQGLILAETEYSDDDEAKQAEVPSFASVEVTQDVLFTGGSLAFTEPDKIIGMVRRLGT